MLSEVAKKFIKAAIVENVDDNNRLKNNRFYPYLNDEDPDKDIYDDDADLSHWTDGSTCKDCKRETTSLYWCQHCNSQRFELEFEDWKIKDDNINELIRESQRNATSMKRILEWIPYPKLKNVVFITQGDFGEISSAEWIDGYILYWNEKVGQWKRKGITKVVLKEPKDSKDSKKFMAEIEHHLYCSDRSSRITRLYGITQRENSKNFSIVMQLIEDGDLNKNLSKFSVMSWEDKLIALSRIAEGLHQIHKANLLHRDFHSRNILLSSTRKNALFITDLGLSEQITEHNNTGKIYGVLPYVAPEVLLGEEYTEAADVYAFGVIMSEVVSGISPFHDVAHDIELATNICNGERPKIQSNTPELIIDLIKSSWKTDSQDRLSAYELRTILKVWRRYGCWPKSKLSKQIKESKNMAPDSVKGGVLHEKAFYEGRCLTDILNLNELKSRLDNLKLDKLNSDGLNLDKLNSDGLNLDKSNAYELNRISVNHF